MSNTKNPDLEEGKYEMAVGGGDGTTETRELVTEVTGGEARLLEALRRMNIKPDLGRPEDLLRLKQAFGQVPSESEDKPSKQRMEREVAIPKTRVKSEIEPEHLPDIHRLQPLEQQRYHVDTDNCRQKANETVDAYASRLEEIFEQAVHLKAFKKSDSEVLRGMLHTGLRKELRINTRSEYREFKDYDNLKRELRIIEADEKEEDSLNIKIKPSKAAVNVENKEKKEESSEMKE